MDPRGLRARLTGAGCTSCGGFIPVDQISILADRGDVAFVEPRCPACGVRGLSVVLGRRGAGASPASATPGDAAVATADVDAMHALLDGWSGDLRTLLDAPDGGARP
jgi:hypothetical protein